MNHASKMSFILSKNDTKEFHYENTLFLLVIAL
jgi:hypothetical protein